MYIEELKEGDEDDVELGLNSGGGIGLISYILTVKEDMHEHMEDELDDALEALWKIWQREIEVSLNLFYLTHQIAVGEAKDNAELFVLLFYAELKKGSQQAIEPRLKTLSQQHLTPKSAPFVQSTILNPIDLGIKVGVYGALAIFEFKKQNPKYTSGYVKNRSVSISSGNNLLVNSVFGYTTIVVYDGLMRVTDGNKVQMNFKVKIKRNEFASYS
ncbi:hypothetical protein Tco_0539601 [Tanacetum coccineum]